MPENTVIQYIKVDEINTSIDPFQPIRSKEIDEELSLSISRFGILQPLLIASDSGKYFCLSGFNRLRAVRSLEFESVPCRVINEAVPNDLRLQLLYLSKLVHGKPTVIEDAYFLKFAQEKLTMDKLLDLMAFMGYKASKHTLSRIFALLELEQDTITAIHQGLLSEKTGRKLLSMKPDDQHLLTGLIGRFKYGGSKQQKLVDLAVELSRRNGCSFTQIYDDWTRGVSVTDRKNIPQQGAMLLDYLHRLYAPRSRQAEEEFRQAVQQLQLPSEMEITHSQAFEKDTVNLRITFQSLSDLEQRIEEIKKAVAVNHQTKG